MKAAAAFMAWRQQDKKAEGNHMLKSMWMFAAAGIYAVATLGAATVGPPETAVPAKMTVTANFDDRKLAPQIAKENIFVSRGKESLPVADWVAARGDHAGLELFFLIDDASESSVANQFGDLRNFIGAQPATTSIGVGYARNGMVEIRQNFTTDRELAAKALRLPLGSAGAYGSVYLSVTDLMKRWPDSPNRHEVLLVTDGIDSAPRAQITPESGHRYRRGGGATHRYNDPLHLLSGREAPALEFLVCRQRTERSGEIVGSHRRRIVLHRMAGAGELRSIPEPASKSPGQPVFVDVPRHARQQIGIAIREGFDERRGRKPRSAHCGLASRGQVAKCARISW
jgi:hypothetical protein